MKTEINNVIDKAFKTCTKLILPTDLEVEVWYSENIDADCSPSSAIYKFRLWLKDRAKKANL